MVTCLRAVCSVNCVLNCVLCELCSKLCDLWVVRRFRQGFLQFFRYCPCRPCRRTLRMSCQERGFYSTRMSMTASGKTDRNGSLMHTTMESVDDTNSTPNASTYRMHPIHTKLRDADSFED